LEERKESKNEYERIVPRTSGLSGRKDAKIGRKERRKDGRKEGRKEGKGGSTEEEEKGGGGTRIKAKEGRTAGR
jgi:hypothetical protein